METKVATEEQIKYMLGSLSKEEQLRVSLGVLSAYPEMRRTFTVASVRQSYKFGRIRAATGPNEWEETFCGIIEKSKEYGPLPPIPDLRIPLTLPEEDLNPRDSVLLSYEAMRDER